MRDKTIGLACLGGKARRAPRRRRVVAVEVGQHTSRTSGHWMSERAATYTVAREEWFGLLCGWSRREVLVHQSAGFARG